MSDIDSHFLFPKLSTTKRCRMVRCKDKIKQLPPTPFSPPFNFTPSFLTPLPLSFTKSSAGGGGYWGMWSVHNCSSLPVFPPYAFIPSGSSACVPSGNIQLLQHGVLHLDIGCSVSSSDKLQPFRENLTPVLAIPVRNYPAAPA